jgi:hypothetical protein
MRRTLTLAALLVLWISPVAIAAQPADPPPEQPVPQMFVTADRCTPCHNGLVTPDGSDVSIGADWQVSIMAHSAKDPYWRASVRREALAHPEARQEIQHECAACHMPMSRYRAKARGGTGRIFEHFEAGPQAPLASRLANEGVACTMCHQISPEGLGTEESFTGGFEVDRSEPLGQRPIYGPFEVDAGRRRLMRSASEFEPEQGQHVQGSELCASCHTLYTHTLGPGGEVVGELPEQMPYLEWRHSAYRETRSCQSCHMPALDDPMPLTGVLGLEREGFSRHVFRGGNFFMLRMLNRFRDDIGVDASSAGLMESHRRTAEHLRSSSARLRLEEAAVEGGRLGVDVVVENLAGHKLPTAYPSRRAWLHVVIRDADGSVVFESGALEADGSIAGNDNDADPARYEPHHQRIETPDQVQIYEAIMVDPNDEVTTGLLAAIRFVKDNRILPRGFDKATAHEDIAVQGAAGADGDFTASRDRVRYQVEVSDDAGPFEVEAELIYQPIAFRWAHNLRQQEAPEIERFISYYEAMSEVSSEILARTSGTVR